MGMCFWDTARDDASQFAHLNSFGMLRCEKLSELSHAAPQYTAAWRACVWRVQASAGPRHGLESAQGYYHVELWLDHPSLQIIRGLLLMMWALELLRRGHGVV
mmetsp:Transcript_3445/g.9946  ORF Transcript_3445/g.9946 Transcript_3445/m.9946 type:complete len:103 (-) Transcript_3445:341-649(-)